MKVVGHLSAGWSPRVATSILVLCVFAALGAPGTTLAHESHVRSAEPAAATAAAGKPRLKAQCRHANVADLAECVEQLRLAKAATARYRDPGAARIDGYLPLSPCEFSAAGTMGEHWVRVDLVIDQALDPREPEMLLYLNTPTGRRLIGVEWSLNAIENGLPHYGTTAPNPARTPPAPAMFGGRVFEGPMQGHNVLAGWEGDFHLTPQPWHYDLHVWLWERNRSGIFAQYNPAVSCG